MNALSVKNLSVDDLRELTDLLKESPFHDKINIMESKGFGGFVECVVFLAETITTIAAIKEISTTIISFKSKKPKVEIEVNGIKVSVKNEMEAAHLIRMLQENIKHES